MGDKKRGTRKADMGVKDGELRPEGRLSKIRGTDVERRGEGGVGAGFYLFLYFFISFPFLFGWAAR